MKHLKDTNLLAKDQHGFIGGRSCNTQLLEIMEMWTKFIDLNIPWDCIYLDFAKAFDSVPHIRLLEKLKACGIRGKLWQRISDI